MEKQTSFNTAIYPSTIKRLREFKELKGLTWDKLFNLMLDNIEKK